VSDDDIPLTEQFFWKGEQWAASAYGVEGIGPGYRGFNISLADLSRPNFPSKGGWLEHMREKSNVDMREFAMAAFMAMARAYTGEKPKPSPPGAVDAILDYGVEGLIIARPVWR